MRDVPENRALLALVAESMRLIIPDGLLCRFASIRTRVDEKSGLKHNVGILAKPRSENGGGVFLVPDFAGNAAVRLPPPQLDPYRARQLCRVSPYPRPHYNEEINVDSRSRKFQAR